MAYNACSSGGIFITTINPEEKIKHRLNVKAFLVFSLIQNTDQNIKCQSHSNHSRNVAFVIPD